MIEVIEEIPDLRHEPRAAPFWEQCDFEIQYLEAIHLMQGRPCPRYARLATMLDYFRHHRFSPEPGDEIMLRHTTWLAHNGTNRAAVLKFLGREVPALLVKGWETDKSVHYRVWRHR